MPHTLKIRDTVIGEGMPKICVPLTGKTAEEVLHQAGSWESARLFLRYVPAGRAEIGKYRRQIMRIFSGGQPEAAWRM